MTKPNLNEEVEAIGAQLNDMKQQRKSGKNKAEDQVDASAQTSQSEEGDSISAEDLSALEAMLAEFDAQDVMDTVSTHARAWMSTLNEDLKHTKPSTLLTVFGLGVIVGRLTK